MFTRIITLASLITAAGLLAFGAVGSVSAAQNAYGPGSSSGNSRGGFGISVNPVPGLALLPAGELSAAEEEALVFMREEEKLAHDVYLFLFDQWGLPLFQNIAASEQNHTDSIAALMEKYDLDDPASTTAGVFNHPDLQALYDQLTAQGSQSLADALKVGGIIEEVDILDLQTRLAEIDNADIQQVFTNLLNGSYNHLRAFTSTLLRQAGETYQPQYMSLDAYQTIVDGSSAGSGGLIRGQGQRGRRGGRGY